MKYDVQVPRYTSYPAIPHWQNNIDSMDWLENLQEAFASKAHWSLYLHIPFCQSLCTFCGCTNIITKDFSRAEKYIQLLLKEMDLYLGHVPSIPESELSQLHIGGGSPSFLKPLYTRILLHGLSKRLSFSEKNFQGSVEIDPRRCTEEHLEVYKDFGFTRLSLGVQDFSDKVQQAINRRQTIEQTAKVVNLAKKHNFSSLNFDLIYGLPMQSPSSIKKTIDQTVHFLPDRIALYSFANVPWVKPQHKLFKESDLPVGEEKALLSDIAREKLLSAGYIEVGMDHFALPTDSMALALKNESLGRNFMGYIDEPTEVLLGLGMSSISETKNMYYQNSKNIEQYTKQIESGNLPIFRGHKLSNEDIQRKNLINNLMTHMKTLLKKGAMGNFNSKILDDFIESELITLQDNNLTVKHRGRKYLRNICSAFDAYYSLQEASAKVFSNSI